MLAIDSLVWQWHLDGKAKPAEQTPGIPHVVPKHRRGGFDTWVAYENNNSQYDCPVHGHIAGQDDEIAPYRLPGYETDALTDLLLDELDRRRDDDKPFSLASPFNLMARTLPRPRT